MATLEKAYECYDFNKMKNKPCKSLFKQINDQVQMELQADVAKDTGLYGNYSPGCTYVALTNIMALFERAHFDLRFSAFGGKLPTLRQYVDHIRNELEGGGLMEAQAQSLGNLVVYYDQVQGCST